MKKLLFSLCLVIIPCFCLCLEAATKPAIQQQASGLWFNTASLLGSEFVCDIEATTDFPRHGEGDFIKLNSGRILYIYTRFNKGADDFSDADLVSIYSDDKGKTWSTTPVVVIKNNEAVDNIMSVSLLRLNTNKIAMFYLRVNSAQDCIPVMRTSTDEGNTWSAPKDCITDQTGYYVLNNARVIKLSSGRLMLAVAQHSWPGQSDFYYPGRLMSYYSDDNGLTWTRSSNILYGRTSSGGVATVQEPGLIELNDGRIMMYCRTNQGSQWKSYSTDNGVTWSDLQPTTLYSPLSPCLLKRTPIDGNLIAIYNRYPNEDAGKGSTSGSPRTPMTVSISMDDGDTWIYHENIEDDPNNCYCYPAAIFEDDYAVIGFYALPTTGPSYGLSNHIWIYHIPSLEKPSKIKVTVNLENLGSIIDKSNGALAVELLDSNKASILDNAIIPLDKTLTEEFVITKAGTYFIRARAGKWLTRTIQIDTVAGADQNIIINLPDGDINSDGKINVADYNVLKKNWFKIGDK